MLDLFTIFSKGGIVLWYFQSTSQIFTPSVNALIKSVILQERTGNNSFDHNSLTLKYKLDNEFELVFVVAYQKILQLSYVDKFLDDIHLEFRDKYKDDLQNNQYFIDFSFNNNFKEILRACEEWGKTQALIPKHMRSFEESLKSKKTVASMIERKGDDKENKKKVKIAPEESKIKKEPVPVVENGNVAPDDIIMQNRAKLAQKMGSPNQKKSKTKSPKPAKEGKKPRIWDLGGTSKDLPDLERTKPVDGAEVVKTMCDTSIVGQMVGGIRDLEVDSDSDSYEEEENEEEVVNGRKQQTKSSGVFSFFKGLVGSKNLSQKDMEPVLEKLKDHLITKNVASDIANKLCNSVAAKLEGKVLGTFDSVARIVKSTMTESLVQILSPTRRVDILRDALEAKKAGRPFVMVFCGVNGVGKSTNLAKICFWLIENKLRVMIAACDTFRAGAVEQLRTHVVSLNNLHPPVNSMPQVQLYEKGYKKDGASLAKEAIGKAREQKVDVVLVDTAGRMQDNEPLMRELAKLIKVNEPDLVLFVGEALVGNEAVDQLAKFNQSLADFSESTKPHLIDGIVLTKFDTIDDKVGAAISMTYMTGQPILFVGTGQTYTDLKSLNSKAVVHALMK
ncbi:signal recognition particle receptor subunit alpha homolog [Halyomorpha halys]|uniref:signal recognition particle receptor subunit alpha homolog n=1 Tax=Halyomorpha halys TaxID=286706 RepID=UPI0006D518D3|nr:signal recognition particle receptor subunit alpha homolog [Halyomorpha halys]